ncbi:MAG: response regulator transcription factor [Thermodesulfobacteriota bacterium]
MKILLATSMRERFAELSAYLKLNYPVELYWAESGEEALLLVQGHQIETVIADETLSDMTGLVFLEKLIRMNPWVNCAVVSALSSENFHEATEGLGILAQLSPDFNPCQVNGLMDHLARIQQLHQK